MANFFMDTFSQILWLFQFVLKKVGDHLPDFVLEETDVCVICVFERDQRHITSEFFHFIMQTLPLIERNGMVVLTMKDHHGRGIFCNKTDRADRSSFADVIRYIFAEQERFW